MWDASKCNLCGDCLVKCRYVDYNKDKAVAEIKLLTEGKEADILSRCITCIACNDYCTTGADPSNLIFKMQEKIGTMPIVANNEPMRNRIVKEVFGELNPGQVIPGDPDKPALSLDAFPFWFYPEGTMESQLFKGMTLVRGGPYSSLLIIHRGGESIAGKYAQQVINNFTRVGKDIVYMHTEGFVLADVKAKELGINVPFKYIHLFEHLRNYLRDHQSGITKLGRKIAYQPSCANRWAPDQNVFLDEIFELIGVERVPRHYDRVNAVCCCGPISKLFPELAIDIQEKNVKDAVEYCAEAMVSCCPVCDATLRGTGIMSGLRMIFITDLCRIALGERRFEFTGTE